MRLIPSFAAIAFVRSISNPCGLRTFCPRSVPTWKPTAGGSRPTTSRPGCIVGGVWSVRAYAAVAAAASAASAASERRSFTLSLLDECDRVRPLPNVAPAACAVERLRERLPHAALEVDDQRLRLRHQPAALDEAGGDAALHALDEA